MELCWVKMSSRSLLGLREENSHYKANKHLERAASLLNQQSFGMKVPGLFKREIDRTRKQEVNTLNTTVKRIDAENEAFSTKNKSLTDANKGLEGTVAFSKKENEKLQKENEKLMTKIKELEQDRDRFEETVRQEYKKDDQERQKVLNKQLEELDNELAKIKKTGSSELYRVTRTDVSGTAHISNTYALNRSNDTREWIFTVSTRMNPKEVNMGKHKAFTTLDEGEWQSLSRKLKELTGKTVDSTVLKSALLSNGSVFTISDN